MNKVLFCGAGYRAGNIGDDAILEGLLISARKYLQTDTQYGALTFNSAFTKSGMRIDEVFNFESEVDSAFSWATHIVLGGASLLSGWSIEYCSQLIIKANVIHKPICMLAAGTSVEPSEQQKQLIQEHFGSLEMITLRSEADRKRAVEWGLHPSKLYVCADSTFAIDYSNIMPEVRTFLGINLVDCELMDKNSYVDSIIDFLTDYPPKMELFFICGETRQVGGFDFEILHKLSNQFPGSSFLGEYLHYRDFLQELSKCKVVITMRMHIMIFCSLLGIPCIPIIREPKMSIMADLLDIKERLPLNFSANAFKDQISKVLENPKIALADEEKVNNLKFRAMQNGNFLCRWIRKEAKTSVIKLNLGCGKDHRSGFINIDVNPIVNPDIVMDFSIESLLSKITMDSVDFILAHDIIEHFWRGDAIKLLKDCFAVMDFGGKIEFTLPDINAIVKRSDFSPEAMIEYIFGMQHLNQGQQFYGHKYGYTRQSFTKLLQDIGFSNVQISDGVTNMVVFAEKI